ncbi:MAG: tRNA (N6-isopentenyl adenosine(37)-C2)-methylthiotransferase MiaB [Nitrospiraceae bacterium]|nr:tRNA (N6-isopentenyl adenosine(37)-C2)-methylthiotransferase MiaB [Nitrospiraceae bacterium]|tara:strand:+ start:6420 stop:7742 length:1323 start_codon:yes stop_codon:yes gene_type:complete
MSHAVYLETFGCQMNEYDSDIIRTILKQHDFKFTNHLDDADVVLMNTCAIRESAQDRIHGRLAGLKRLKHERGLVVGLLGCMAQNLKKDLMKADSVIDVLVGPDGYRKLPNLLTKALDAHHPRMEITLSESETYADIVPEQIDSVTALVSIMRGCDNFCTFCVVPYTRGRERSQNPESIIFEVRQLANNGIKQVTLLGQNVNSYAVNGTDFVDLIIRVADIPGIERVRFTSPHPKDFPEKLIDAIIDHPRICKHIHLPLQSGSDRILELMNRTYTQQAFIDLANDMRNRCPQLTLTTDVIVGFCSESEEDFADTYRVMEKIGFNAAFTFMYSERKNTIAARHYPDNVPQTVKVDRVSRLVELQNRMSRQLNRALIGKKLKVLVQGNAKKSEDQWMGRTDGNTMAVFPKTGKEVYPGKTATITISDATSHTLIGETIPSFQ